MTREQQIAELRAQGLSWRKVGRQLGVSGQRAQELLALEQYRSAMRAWGVERGDRLGGRMVRRLVFAGFESPSQVARGTPRICDDRSRELWQEPSTPSPQPSRSQLVNSTPS